MKKLTNKQLLSETVLLLFAVFAIFMMAALITFDPADPSWSQTAWHEPIKNIGGAAGAYLADILLFTFGVIAYLIPFVILYLCWLAGRFIYYRSQQPVDYFNLSLRLIGVISVLFSACALAAMNVDDWYFYASGGVIGSLLVLAMLPILNFTGSTLLLLAVWAGGITLLTGYSWLLIAEKIGQIITAIINFFLIKKQTIKQENENIVAEFNETETTQDQDIAEIPIVESGDEQLSLHLEVPTEYSIDTNFPPRYYKGELIYAQPVDETEMDEQGKPELAMMPPPTLLSPDVEYSRREILPSAEPALHNLADFVELEATVTDESLTISDQLQSDITTEIEPLVDEETEAEQQLQQPAELVEQQTEVVDQRIEHDNQSLIHPLLMRNEAPLVKPTTPMPSLALLTRPAKNEAPVDVAYLKATAERIERALADYRVKANVVGYFQGPVITLYELDLAPGVKAARISALARDLARALAVTAVRVVEVIPGKSFVGLELPNKNRQTVYIREVLDSNGFRESKSPLTVVLGKDIAGQPVVAELGKMPHLLVAGTTGSGKSVGVNAMILSILYKSKPEDVRFIMIDPKMLELSVYEGIPHLLTEVVTDMKDAANALRWCVGEMERRYKLMSALGVRNLAGYNDCIAQADKMGRPIPDPFWKPGDSMETEHPTLQHLPYIVVMVDEFADLIMAVGKKVEELIARLAQKARAAGIHLVLATQRPSVDVITGLIKANIPTRIAFTVSSKIDSRTILDQGGAESLLGMGDMLYLPPNSSLPQRVHGAFVRDEEVHAVVQDWKARGKPTYITNITASVEEGESSGDFESSEEYDPLFDQAVAFVVDKRKASISSVQRQFRIGYNRAARIIEQMETEGIVSSPGHNGNREVLAPPSFNDNDY